jgi:hypothetical protein
MTRVMDTIIKTRHPPRLTRALRGGPALTYQDTVRVWQSSPKGLSLQVRMRGSYVTLPLTFDEAEALRNALTVLLPGQWETQPVEVTKF